MQPNVQVDVIYMHIHAYTAYTYKCSCLLNYLIIFLKNSTRPPQGLSEHESKAPKTKHQFESKQYPNTQSLEETLRSVIYGSHAECIVCPFGNTFKSSKENGKYAKSRTKTPKTPSRIKSCFHDTCLRWCGSKLNKHSNSNS